MKAEEKPRIRLPNKPKPPPPDALARKFSTMLELARFVNALRTGLAIRQSDLAARADVSRQWIVALEQGKPSLEAAKVFRTLEALGFELTITPYDPPPAWMLRAVAFAEAKRKANADGRRVRRNTRRARAREDRLAANLPGGRVFLE